MTPAESAAQIELEDRVSEAVRRYEAATARRCYSIRIDHFEGSFEVDAWTCGPSRQPDRVLSRTPDR